MTPATNIQKKIIEQCGSTRDAVHEIMQFNRTVWNYAFKPATPSTEILRSKKRKSNLRKIILADIVNRDDEQMKKRYILFIEALTLKKLCTVDKGEIALHVNAFQPMPLVRALLGNIKHDSELRYHIMASIRQRYNLKMLARTAHEFHLIADAINSLRSPQLASEENKRKKKSQYIDRWHYQEQFFPYLLRRMKEILNRNGEKNESIIKNQISAFVECSRAVGHLEVDYHLGFIRLKPAKIDPEYILSNLFGMPTRIPGFDKLFGGGGIILAQDPADSETYDPGGRTILIKGRCGTGKSLLALTIAVEVARKGGIVCYMPMEQTAGECLYALESMGTILKDDPIYIATNIEETTALLEREDRSKGGLVILDTIKDNYSSFLSALQTNAKELSGSYPLRLVIADPINSISGVHNEPITELRLKTFNAISQIKNANTNVLFVAENSDLANEFMKFAENIVDTVIDLSFEEKYGYSQRYFQVTKSRMQREMRGAHPFRIVSGKGFEIYPSSSAVISQIALRSSGLRDQKITFGLKALDKILGPGSLTSGDIIAIKGPSGSLKTPLGVYFLLGKDSTRSYKKTESKPCSLFFSARDKMHKVRSMLEQEFVQIHSKNKSHKDLEDIMICTLPHNFIHPGNIFQSIEQKFLEARLAGRRIDRVMIDNVAYWEKSCPFISDDNTFGSALLDFLRARGVTTCIVCGEIIDDSKDSLQQSIIDGADCVINLGRFRFRGMNRIVVSVLKTHTMSHRREAFELEFDGSNITLRSYSSLLRFASGQELKTVKIRLFLHSDSNIQAKYHNSIKDSLLAMLSSDTTIEPVKTAYLNKVTSMSSFSTMDELQILQVDEFQLKGLEQFPEVNNIPLHCFDNSLLDDDEWHHFLKKLKRRTFTKKQFAVVPYLMNISLLAYRSDLLNPQDVSSWEAIARNCSIWEEENANGVFFDFPKTLFENYNCLFFEILLSFLDTREKKFNCIIDIIRSKQALYAAHIMRILCRRAHFNSLSTTSDSKPGQQVNQEQKEEAIKVNLEGLVWRHWYTTMSQMLSELDPTDRESIKVCPLPKEISVSGEWFLAVPQYSAAPDVGLEIIKTMTCRDAEFNRMQLGAGLPTRAKFYEFDKTDSSAEIPISPYFSMDMETLKKLVENSFQRSSLFCYSKISRVLAYYLMKIIEIPNIFNEAKEEKKKRLEKTIRILFNTAEKQMHLLGLNGIDCTADAKCCNPTG